MQIDHLVWFCGNLAEGRATVASHADAVPAYGGAHDGEGTANYLLSLGPTTYLEILGRDPGQAESSLDPAVRALSGMGLFHWAMSGVALEELQSRAREAGLAGGELVRGGRTKPDGQRLEWTCFGLRDHGFGALIPFFIDWHETPHPAASAPRGATLTEFEIFSPRAGALQAIFDTLRVPLAVTWRAEAGITATLRRGRGDYQLHSYTPVPIGYII